jgi:hypothetical protein
MELDADGNGKYTGGAMTQHLPDDTHTAGQNTCSYRLAGGTYQMTGEHEGTATISWTLQPGSDNHCGAHHRDLKLLGFQESARDSKPFSGSANFFLADDGSSRWVGASDQGVVIGSCVPSN